MNALIYSEVNMYKKMWELFRRTLRWDNDHYKVKTNLIKGKAKLCTK